MPFEQQMRAEEREGEGGGGGGGGKNVWGLAPGTQKILPPIVLSLDGIDLTRLHDHTFAQGVGELVPGRHASAAARRARAGLGFRA